MANTRVGEEKRKINRVTTEDGDYIQILPETSADQVVVNNTAAGITSTNVQAALKEINDVAKKSGVTGVKGNKETTYRKGDVNLTPANIGALPDTTLYGHTLDLSYASDTGIITATLKDQKGAALSTKTIDLPLEMLVESGTVETCKENDKPVPGYKIGDKYIDLVLAKNTEHIYILVSDLIDQITGETTGTGNVISTAIVNGNKITFTKGVTAVTSVAGKTGSTITLDKNDVQLGNVDNTADTNKNVATAKKLATARNIALSGDVSGNADFDGSENVTITTTLPNVVTASNTAKVVTYNAKGQVQGGGSFVSYGTTTNNKPAADLVVGGIFFEYQA